MSNILATHYLLNLSKQCLRNTYLQNAGYLDNKSSKSNKTGILTGLTLSLF